MSPSSPLEDGVNQTYTDYYTQVFGVNSIDPEQFLVYTAKRYKTTNQEGKSIFATKRIYYLPQFLKMTGMTEEQKADRKSMTEVARYTKVTPAVREAEHENFFRTLRDLIDAQPREAQLFNIRNDNKLTGFLMNRPTISFGFGGFLEPDRGNFFIKGKITDTEIADLENWAIIWEKDRSYANGVEAELIKASGRIGVRMNKPFKYELKNNGQENLKKAVDLVMKQKPQIILLIASHSTLKNGYKTFKKYCNESFDVQTQVIKLDPYHFKKNGLFDSVAKQMATKCGWRPWLVQKPEGIKKEVVMMIGADVYHKRGNESIAAVVGTIDKEFSEYISFTSKQDKRG